LNNGEVREFECDAFLRVSRCEDGLADDVDAVGKEDGAVGVRVDDTLNVIADIFPCLRFYVIGDDDVALSEFIWASSTIGNARSRAMSVRYLWFMALC
jgi:hypothetical protein